MALASTPWLAWATHWKSGPEPALGRPQSGCTAAVGCRLLVETRHSLAGRGSRVPGDVHGRRAAEADRLCRRTQARPAPPGGADGWARGKTRLARVYPVRAVHRHARPGRCLETRVGPLLEERQAGVLWQEKRGNADAARRALRSRCDLQSRPQTPALVRRGRTKFV